MASPLVCRGCLLIMFLSLARYLGIGMFHHHEEELADDVHYVFLQKFSLEGSGGHFFHTEVLVCPRKEFSEEDKKIIDDSVVAIEDFVEMDETWWSQKTYNCIELGYGGANCGEECCGVPHKDDQFHYPLNAHRAMISNADTSDKSLYLYGTGSLSGDAAYHHACDAKCWSNWAGRDYNPLTNNCNTFTSTILSCVYGLSQKKPHLGPSDMVTVKCECSSDADETQHVRTAVTES